MKGTFNRNTTSVKKIEQGGTTLAEKILLFSGFNLNEKHDNFEALDWMELEKERTPNLPSAIFSRAAVRSKTP